jgi:cellulose synthase/poly-beta-1,6-N-acetylglucosamine synthase-like glycosyltransferase
MIVSLIYFVLFFGIFLLIVLLQVVNRPKAPTPLGIEPYVSILIAVRNEEHTIISCLEAIGRLDYPPQKIEILLGDDASTDNTYLIIQNYIRHKPFYRCVRINQNLGQARGKANVLAHLTRLATSDIYFITDADILVPSTWVRDMLAATRRPKTGIVTGITTVTGAGLFPELQAIDWINALGLMQIVSDLNLPVSTMGNNMLVTRAAYEATGGYENMPFSVTEDVQLFKAVTRQKFKTCNIFHPGVLAFSTPAGNWAQLLHQRKRWMQGIWHLPWYMSCVLIIYASFYAFCLPFVAYTTGWVVLSIFLAKLFLQTLFINRCLARLNLRYRLDRIILFEFYAIFVSLITILFFLLPFKVKWKERKY